MGNQNKLGERQASISGNNYLIMWQIKVSCCYLFYLSTLDTFQQPQLTEHYEYVFHNSVTVSITPKLTWEHCRLNLLVWSLSGRTPFIESVHETKMLHATKHQCSGILNSKSIDVYISLRITVKNVCNHVSDFCLMYYILLPCE